MQLWCNFSIRIVAPSTFVAPECGVPSAWSSLSVFIHFQNRSAPQIHIFASKIVHFQNKSAPQIYIFPLKFVHFEKRVAPHFTYFRRKLSIFKVGVRLNFTYLRRVLSICAPQCHLCSSKMLHLQEGVHLKFTSSVCIENCLFSE